MYTPRIQGNVKLENPQQTTKPSQAKTSKEYNAAWPTNQLQRTESKPYQHGKWIPSPGKTQPHNKLDKKNPS